MKRKVCKECSDVPVFHFLSKWSIALDAFLYFIFSPVGKILHLSKYSTMLSEQFFPILFKVLAFFRIGTIALEPNERDSMRTVTLWNEAKKRGIYMYEFKVLGKPLCVFVAKYKGERILFEGLPRPKTPSLSIDWMDNKSKMKKAFLTAGIPVARGGSFFFYKKALSVFRTLRKPVITKPSFGSRSRHTTIHMETEKEFKRGFLIAKQLSPWVIVEEELQGPVFRVSLVGGRVVGVLRRDPPMVHGDGVKTIKELIEEENKNPKRANVFHEIPIDDFVVRELSHQRLTLASIPKKGERVVLHSKVGRSQGGTNANVTREVHPENIQLFERIAEVLGDAVIGVDFIIGDMKKPWQEQTLCGVIECNSIPFLDLHHFPYEGEPVDVMSKLWDIVFPNSSLVKTSSIES